LLWAAAEKAMLTATVAELPAAVVAMQKDKTLSMLAAQ
jgi:hypothetical protein